MKLTTDAAYVIGNCSAHPGRNVAQIVGQPLPCPWYICTIIDGPLDGREPLTQTAKVFWRRHRPAAKTNNVFLCFKAIVYFELQARQSTHINDTGCMSPLLDAALEIFDPFDLLERINVSSAAE